jgi:tetrahydromethanopterin S-methyltransferase subunit E
LTSIGLRQYGSLQRVEDTHVPIAGVVYETRSTLSEPPPAGQELDFLYYIKNKVESEEDVRVVFAEVIGNSLTVQWKSLGSPVAVSTIIALIVAAVIAFFIYMTMHETYKIVSIISPENISMFFNIIFLILVLSVISSITGMFRR